MAERFTKPYVDALFEVATSRETVEKVVAGLDQIVKLLASSEELRLALANPAHDRARKAAVVEALADRVGLTPLGRRLLQTLLGNRRLTRIDGVLRAIRERLDRDQNVVEAALRTASPMVPEVEAGIRTALEKRTRRTVRLRTTVDPALIGGFVVRLESEVFDASLASRLEKARRALRTPPLAARA